jgi:hypothetical protein
LGLQYGHPGKWRRTRGVVKHHRVLESRSDERSVLPGNLAAVLGDDRVPHIDYCVYDPEFIFEYCDVFTVGARRRTEEVARAFIHEVCLEGLSNTRVRVIATFDDGALVNVIDTMIFDSIRNKLQPLMASKRVLRMANGVLVPSAGTWIGRVIVGNVCAEGAFEIFPSGGAWDMLFGKPMLLNFNATHKYTYGSDTVTLNSDDDTEILENSNPEPTKSEGLRKIKVAVAQVSNPGEHWSGESQRTSKSRE